MRTRGRRIVRIGSRKECFHGLLILQSLGLNPTVDNLKISFNDPVALSADLCKLQNRYAFQGRFQGKYDFQTRQNVIPVLYIDGQDMGTIDNLKIQALKGLAEPSLAADENVKKVWEIKANRINLDLDLTQDIQVLAPMGHKIVPKFSKLVIYEKDGVFTEHSDSHEENHFGSLVIVLPVPYEGGNFILSENANELTLPFDDMFKRNKIPWIAFYSDVKYKVEVANSGVRMILQYTLTAEKNGPKEDYSIRSKIEGRYSREPESRYRFKGYNEEVLTLIRDKLNTIFAQLKEKAIEESKNDEQEKENMEEGKIEVEKEKDEEEEEDEEEYEYYQDKNKESLKIDNTPPEGIAIMLKRRYEKSSSSLKGSDSTLYNYLKQHFTVDLKQIILEQNHNDYPFRDDLIEIVAISQIDDLQESCSSEEELQLDPHNMRVPSKCSKKGTQNRALKMTHQQKFGKKKRVFLVSGLCPQNLKKTGGSLWR